MMTKSQRWLLGIAIGLGGLWGLGQATRAMAQVLFPTLPTLPDSQTTQVVLDVGSSISLECPQSVAMPEIVGIGDAKANFICEVNQTLGRGYVIDVANMTDLVKNGVSGPSDKQKFVPDAGKMGVIKAGAWAISANNGMNWYTAGGRLATVNRPGTRDKLNFTLGVHAGADDGLTAWMESGDYSGSLVLTATILW